ncbi:SsgA family sporulation/cell division regulator [Streptomyces sp. NPDC056512]|uniref:SsgA family sporulation/cell division regulator n=1 Tax=Streptomyces sp. NPDC056512 TaxID=3345846 RepID=UPI0036A61BA5
MPKPVTLIEEHPHRVTTLHHRAGLVHNARSPAPLALELHYTSFDPYAVRIKLAVEGAEVRWALSRESLLVGLRRHDGLGDVAVWPVRPPNGPPLLRIRLGPPGRCAVMETELGIIAEWLDVTHQLVPPGCEPPYIHWDGFLSALLDEF